MKRYRNRMPVGTVIGVGKILQPNLLLVAGLFLSTTQANAQGVKSNDPTGVYTLVAVNGSKLPADVSHGDVAIQVRSGTFTINDDGTCSSKVIFVPHSGATVTQEVDATYTQEGSQLNMQWKGAGKTAGTVEGDSFAMNNEGMIFAYEKQPATAASGRRNELVQEAAGPLNIGSMIIQTIPAKHYLFGGIDTDFKSMGKPVAKTLTTLADIAGEKKVGLHGPVLHYYYNAPHRSPEKAFKMETGFFVPETIQAIGDFKVRELPEFKCATILYVGPGPRIGDAWQALYQAIRARRLTPTDEERELYLYWESADSPNNIVQVQVGVK